MKLQTVLRVLYHFGIETDEVHGLTSAGDSQFCLSTVRRIARNSRVRVDGQEWLVSAVRRNGEYLGAPLYRITVVA